MSESKMGYISIGFVLGTAVGAALALLAAPARGAETRQRLETTAREAAQRALAWSKDAATQGRARLSQIAEKLNSGSRFDEASVVVSPEEHIASAQETGGETK